MAQKRGADGGASNRPLRVDAERNRLRILDAARELFAERGVEVSLDDIAARAGVGVGTVYRRYPGREQLVEALFDERLDRIVALADDALQHPDPWTGFAGFMEAVAELMSDHGLRDTMFGRAYGHRRVAEARRRISPVVQALLDRCQAAGVVRSDLVGADVALLHFMTSALVDYTDRAEPGLWRRYLGIILDGLRHEETPLLPPPPDLEVLERIGETWMPPRQAE